MRIRTILLACVVGAVVSMLAMAGAYANDQDIYYDSDNQDIYYDGDYHHIYYDSIVADDIAYENSPINKLGRGTINTATCWAEVPARVFEVSNRHDPLTGFTLGTVEGVFTGIFRGLTGIFDAVTFIIPPYDEPIMQPEYALTRADREIKEYLW
ncbi:MAG: exosortase system-associated protein, TIGR04073 family [Candidatus Omnitrophica bacterium]|nr:exosortase system-associated protein, TIGR04073 family [Candidatus Omnitrophota bacterium]